MTQQHLKVKPRTAWSTASDRYANKTWRRPDDYKVVLHDGVTRKPESRHSSAGSEPGSQDTGECRSHFSSGVESKSRSQRTSVDSRRAFFRELRQQRSTNQGRDSCEGAETRAPLKFSAAQG